MGAPGDLDCVAGSEFSLDLTVSGQLHLHSGRDDADFDMRAQVENQGAVRERMWADGGEGEDFGVRCVAQGFLATACLIVVSWAGPL